MFGERPITAAVWLEPTPFRSMMGHLQNELKRTIRNDTRL